MNANLKEHRPAPISLTNFRRVRADLISALIERDGMSWSDAFDAADVESRRREMLEFLHRVKDEITALPALTSGNINRTFTKLEQELKP